MNADDLFRKIGVQAVEADVLHRELEKRDQRILELESRLEALAVENATAEVAKEN